MNDYMLYHEFKTFNGDILFEEVPDIHIDVEHSERPFAQTKADYLALFRTLTKEAGVTC